jgi:holo-[acyl-carrier protein] synthase
VIGIGIDAVDVDRFRAMLTRRPGLAERMFTEGEQAYGNRASDPAPRLAARFAAKEAVMKALGVGLGAFNLRDVEVVKAPSGQPSIVLSGKAAALAADRGVTSWRLSLTHTATVAEAVVVAL